MNLKKLATSGAALVVLTAPAFLASQAHADTNPALSSPEWTGLHTANDGGSNVAYVDKEGLSQTEVAQIKKLLPDTKVKGCSIYKLVYEKDASAPTTPSTTTPSSTPSTTAPSSTSTLPKPVKNFVDKVLPNTGDTTIQAYGTLAGIGLLAGASFLIIKNKKGRATLIVLLAAGGALGFSLSANAYTGNDLAPKALVVKDTNLSAPEIKGYHFVGYLELEHACLTQPTPAKQEATKTVENTIKDKEDALKKAEDAYQKELTKRDKALLEAKDANQKELDKLTKSYELKLADKEKACQTAKEAYEKALAEKDKALKEATDAHQNEISRLNSNYQSRLDNANKILESTKSSYETLS